MNKSLLPPPLPPHLTVTQWRLLIYNRFLVLRFLILPDSAYGKNRTKDLFDNYLLTTAAGSFFPTPVDESKDYARVYAVAENLALNFLSRYILYSIAYPRIDTMCFIEGLRERKKVFILSSSFWLLMNANVRGVFLVRFLKFAFLEGEDMVERRGGTEGLFSDRQERRNEINAFHGYGKQCRTMRKVPVDNVPWRS